MDNDVDFILGDIPSTPILMFEAQEAMAESMIEFDAMDYGVTEQHQQ